MRARLVGGQRHVLDDDAGLLVEPVIEQRGDLPMQGAERQRTDPEHGAIVGARLRCHQGSRDTREHGTARERWDRDHRGIIREACRAASRRKASPEFNRRTDRQFAPGFTLTQAIIFVSQRISQHSNWTTSGGRIDAKVDGVGNRHGRDVDGVRVR